ncbi:MAG: hypothetical protein ACE5G0_16705 [Rhodothermales bacterium]
MDPDLTTEALRVLSHSFGVAPKAALAHTGRPTLDDVRRFLVGHITELLDRNPGMLLSILYRVDVAEQDVKRVFSLAEPEHMALQLADLLIERQLQKLRHWQQYRNRAS